MGSDKTLEKKVTLLEERVKKLEAIVALLSADNELMEAYYQKAKAVVITNQKASVIFLQRKLLIDFDRATQLLKRLESEGIIGPEEGFKPRKVFKKK